MKKAYFPPCQNETLPTRMFLCLRKYGFYLLAGNAEVGEKEARMTETFLGGQMDLTKTTNTPPDKQ